MRRFLGLAIAVSLLFLLSPSQARPRGITAVAAATAFLGNPNVVASAINVTPTPVTFTATTSTTSAGSGRTLTSVSSTSGLLLGMVCTGTGLPTNPATIMAVDSGTSTVFLSHAAVSNNTGVTISCGANPIYGSRFTCEGAGDQSRSGTHAGGCFIQVSLDGVTETGTNASGVAVRPWQDLEVCWNFGDPNGTELFTRPTDGATVNANSDQCGPQAAYVYRDTVATNHTITATIRARNGGTATNPSYLTVTATQQVVIQQFNNSGGTWYVDNNNGLTTNDCSAPVQGAGNVGPCKLLENINPKFSLSHVTILLAEGSVWNCSTMGSVPATTDCLGPSSNSGTTGWRVGSYQGASGAGAKPTINITDSACALCGFNSALYNPAGTNTKEDVVFSNLKLTTPSGSTTASGAFITASVSSSTAYHADWYYYDNIDFQNYAAIPHATPGGIDMTWGFASNVGTAQGVGIWGGTTANSLNYSYFNGTITQSGFDTILTVNSETSGRNDDGSSCVSGCLRVGAGLVSSSVAATSTATFTSGSTTSGTLQVTVTCPCTGARIGLGMQLTGGGIGTVRITGQISGTAGADGVYSTDVDPGTHSPTGGTISVFVESQLTANTYKISAYNSVAAQAMYAAPSYGHLFFGGPSDWMFNYFQSMSGNGQYSSNVLIHFWYPETQNHLLFKWVNFGRTGNEGHSLDAGFVVGSGYDYCINGNYGINVGSGTVAQNIANLGFFGNTLVSEVKCGTDGISDTSASYFMDVSEPSSNSATVQVYQVRNVVIERSAIGNLNGSQPVSPTLDDWGIAFRDNRMWTGSGSNMIVPSANISGSFALASYRNKIWLSSSTGAGSAPWTQLASAGTASAVTVGASTFTISGSICPYAYGTKVFFSGANLNGAWTAGSNTTNPYYIVTQNDAGQCSVATTPGGTVVNAAASSTGSFNVTPVWNVPWEVTDNVIEDDRTTPDFFVNMNLSNNNGATGNTSLFDRNNYYFPNASLGLSNTGFASGTFAAWQGAPNNFDANGSAAASTPSGWTCSSSANWNCFH